MTNHKKMLIKEQNEKLMFIVKSEEIDVYVNI